MGAPTHPRARTALTRPDPLPVQTPAASARRGAGLGSGAETPKPAAAGDNGHGEASRPVGQGVADTGRDLSLPITSLASTQAQCGQLV